MKNLKSLDNPAYYLNREFTALEFNERVLQLAEDPNTPLLEKVRFVCICSNNLDEFFEIRVAGLKEMFSIAPQKTGSDGLRFDETFYKLSILTHKLIERIYNFYNNKLLPELRKENIYFYEKSDWCEEINLWVRNYFKNEILPIISPIALDLAHPFPQLFNKSLNFIISLEGKDAFDRNINYAVVHAPRILPRMILLPKELTGDKDVFIYLSSIIKAHISSLFPGMEIKGCYAFRITRNSDLYFNDEGADDLAEAIQRELSSRHYGHVVRLEIDSDCPKEITEFLLNKYHLSFDDLYYCHGPVNLQRLMSIIKQVKKPKFEYPAFTPSFVVPLKQQKLLLNLLDEQDILIHHPYESYETVIDFVKQAAIDPNVLAIKQTLYRTHINSAMVKALLEASRRGKEVTAIIELRARFDEESNLKLATQLHEAGVLVLYGIMGYKTHAKMTLVVRRVLGKLKPYVHLGTGNYHEETSKHYTDFSLLTSHPEITADIQSIFQQLTGLGKMLKLKQIYHSPFTLQKRLLELIELCAKAASQKKDAKIFIKVNGLTDQKIIEALYKASQQGANILLFIRGACCLKPNIPNVSDNIKVVSIVGRFLEHHRIYYFKHDDEENYYCASADLMERNLYARVEIMFPILSEDCKKRINEEILRNYSKDNTNTWELQKDGSYKPIRNGNYSAQTKLLEIKTSN